MGDGRLMTNKDFVRIAKAIATDWPSSYMLGAFGSPATQNNINRLCLQYGGNEKYRTSANAILGKGYMFDCCGLVKAILWGWSGDMTHIYGGAAYQANGVPDVNETGLLNACEYISTDFTDIAEGEFLWLSGHCGIYIGDGLAVEATPAFNGGVQITAVGNIGKKDGYPTRTWTKHGRLPYVTYEAKASAASAPERKVIPIGMLELSKGSKGEQVRTLQRLLISNGYSCGVYGADGDFGNDTKAAVTAYQKANLTACIYADGIAGERTWKSILGGK